MSDDVLICPHCGEENLASATRCLHCGLPLEEAFAIDGLKDISSSLTGDFVKAEEESLPDLFRDLHEEADLQKKAAKIEALSSIESTTNKAEEDASEELEAEDTIPEWLKKIRQRAQVEDDSSGDLIKKVNARDEIPQPSEQSQVDNEFEDWLRQIRLNARRDSIQPLVEEPTIPRPDEETPSWLQKLREIKETENEPEPELKPQTEETLPEWVEEEQEHLASSDSSLSKGHPEHTQPLQLAPEVTRMPGESTGLGETGAEKIEIGKNQTKEGEALEKIIGQVGFPTGTEGKAFLEAFEQERPETADLLLLRSQRDRAKDLKDMVENEGKAGVLPKQQKAPRNKFFQLVLYLLVLSVIALPLFSGAIDTKINGTMQPVSLAFFDSVSQLTAQEYVLIVIDYQPGSSAEMAAIFQPVLDHLTRQAVKKSFITTYPEGVWLTSQLIGQEESLTETGTTYLPGAKIGLMNLSLDTSAALSPGLVSSDLFGSQYDLDYDSIILLTDSFNGGKNWLELVGPFISADKSLLMVASTQEAAMFLPYFDSAQLDGLLAGLNESALYNNALGKSSSISINRSYQAGLLIMAACFVIGIITSIGVKERPESQEDVP